MRNSLVPLAFVLLSACGSAEREPLDHGELPESCKLAPKPSDYVYPGGSTGTDVGAVLANAALSDCDGAMVDFAQVLAGAKVLLLNVGAGWCQPCIDETETIEADIFRPHCEQGLRVVQILFQDEEARPATKLFCSQWTERFGLSFPVLVDPLFEMQYLFEDVQAQTPINLLVDQSATIRWRLAGSVPSDLERNIEELLAE